jgi:hypothetical protein
MVSSEQHIRPGDIELSDFRRIGREVIDAFAEYQADLSEGSVTNDAPEAVAARFVDELVSNNVRLAQRLHNLVSEHPDFEVLHERTLYLHYFRFVPNALAERKHKPEVQAQLDRLNEEIVEAIQRSGVPLITTTGIRGGVAIRMSICSHRTVDEDVDATFEAIARWGRLLSRINNVRDQESSEVETMPCSSESYSLPTEVSAT